MKQGKGILRVVCLLAMSALACGGTAFSAGDPFAGPDATDAPLEGALDAAADLGKKNDDAESEGEATTLEASDKDTGWVNDPDTGTPDAGTPETAADTGVADTWVAPETSLADTYAAPDVWDGCTAATHSNGFGQTWTDCTPLGTHTAAEGKAACDAYLAAQPSDSPAVQCIAGSCDGVWYCADDVAGGCLGPCWSFSGTTIGETSGGCACPFVIAGTWQ